jgi:hypothetical protein
MLLLACITTTASGAAPRDRDHDRLPDRWEKRYHLSIIKKSGMRDPDGDRLRNRREYRLRTNPRKRDTDGDGLWDRAEVRRHHTNPRKRDTDGDGFGDRREIRAGTNPRRRRSHPRRGGSSPPGHTPPPPGGFPNPASTGVPAGWTPAQTRSSSLTVTTPGAIVQDIRFTNGAGILVRAPNVTIRRVDMQGGTISNQFGTAPVGCGHNLVVEDTTFGQIPGQFAPSDSPVVGEGSYTARRIEVDGRGEGPRLSDCGPVTLEDSFIRLRGADTGTSACNQVHSDGVQAVAAVGASARNNTIIMETPCGTSPWFVVNPSVNKGIYNVDRLLVSGGGYSFRQEVVGSVTGLRIVSNSWVYGPLTEMDCSVLSPWEAKLVTIDSNYQVSRVVGDQPCR